jgi:Single-stranded DNA-specific exonuclease
MPTDIEQPLSNPGNWVSRQNTGTYKILAEKLQTGFNYSNILIQLLANRELDSKDKVESFLNPSLKDLHNPELLPNIIPAVERLKQAIDSGEKVLVFGDYDADGIISTAILYNFLKKIGANVSHHIPNRFEDGYDINIDFIKKVNLEKSYDLIICVDCGTNAAEVIEYVTYSKDNNVDVIVCDHHEAVFPDLLKKTEKNNSYKYIGDSLDENGINNPGAADYDPNNKSKKSYIIINSKLPGSNYPFKFLSGAGVTFKFIMAILRNINESFKSEIPKDYLNSILDLVAISTVADLMPLVDENRVIVKEGLKKIKFTSNLGLKELVRNILGDKDEFNTYDIGFIISPHLNASGRIKNAGNSLNLLLEYQHKDEEIFNIEISSIIDELKKSNSDRKEIQQKTVSEVLENNDFSRIVLDEKIFIAKSANWSEGVLGIVASEIVKKYNIPVILFKEADEILKGSGRSIEKFNLYDNLVSLSHYFKKYGGHKQACGITMELKDFEDFKSSMIELANACMTEKDLEKIYYFEAEINFSEINTRLISDIRKLEPFGIGNTKPVFLTKDCMIISKPRLLKNDRHMILKLKNNGKDFEAIIFNCSDLYPDFTSYIVKNLKDKNTADLSLIDILYNIELKKSPYDDNKEIQLCIKSLKVKPDLVKYMAALQ